MRRRTPPVPHREFFRAMNSEEVIACLCTCTRAADHWYGAPIGAPALTAEALLGAIDPEPVGEATARS
ncbi:hypothetical protein M3147_12310 [Agromyces mediolanus]|uniref:hypothetical protein n=1 Tax=Agromyces mediolanus TaxID=41986 RepID=UPI00203D2724|nr:hypothetical protein [Agromyces mediolanus]MCM3658035.1 hypothetical protein [Agromyces mediolanus]